MILKNAEIYDENFNLVKADIPVKDGKINRVAPDIAGGKSIDLTGCLIAPGFVDIHIHGCMCADTCDGTREALSTMEVHLVENGVTPFCPTTMTVSTGQIEKARSTAKDCMDNPPEGASVRGVTWKGRISLRAAGAKN